MTDPFFHPVSGFDLPRFAGIPTFMRLPHVPPDHPRFAEVQIGLIGAPWDGGITNRPGPRMCPGSCATCPAWSGPKMGPRKCARSRPPAVPIWAMSVPIRPI